MFEGIGGYDLLAREDLGSEKSWACICVVSIERASILFLGALALIPGLVGGIYCPVHLPSRQNGLLWRVSGISVHLKAPCGNSVTPFRTFLGDTVTKCPQLDPPPCRSRNAHFHSGLLSPLLPQLCFESKQLQEFL